MFVDHRAGRESRVSVGTSDGEAEERGTDAEKKGRKGGRRRGKEM